MQRAGLMLDGSCYICISALNSHEHGVEHKYATEYTLYRISLFSTIPLLLLCVLRICCAHIVECTACIAQTHVYHTLYVSPSIVRRLGTIQTLANRPKHQKKPFRISAVLN